MPAGAGSGKRRSVAARGRAARSQPNAYWRRLTLARGRARAIGRLHPRLKLGDPPVQRRHGLFDLGQGEALGDVLRAVPVEGLDRDDDAALDARAIIR